MFTAKDVMALREMSGAGMMDCKKALTACEGDMDKAMDYLREKSLAASAKKAARIAAEGIVSSYVTDDHKVGAIVEVNCETDFVAKTPEFKSFVRDIAMHIAAANPSFLDRTEVPNETLDKEREILRAQALNEGKPEKIVDRMVEGRVEKFYKENCLVDQAFIKDGNMDVNAYVNATAKKLGGDIKIVEYTHFIKGEGLEKRVDDFAAEVAAAVKG